MRLLYYIVDVGFTVYNFLIVARCLLSWLPMGANNSIARFVYDMTEPVMAPFRRLFGNAMMGIDFSPIIAIFALGLAHRLALQLIISLM
jgi:YggT family protein